MDGLNSCIQQQQQQQQQSKKKELTHVKLHVSIILLFLFRYRNGGFITRRGTAIEETQIIDHKTEHNNEIYVRCEMRYTSLEKIQSSRFCAGPNYLDTNNQNICYTIRIKINSQNTTSICRFYLFVRVTTCFGPN